MLHHAQALQLTHYDVLKTLVTAADTALSEVDAQRDQAMFIDYNIRPFSMPTDWVFEPCASHYDTVRRHFDMAALVSHVTDLCTGGDECGRRTEGFPSK